MEELVIWVAVVAAASFVFLFVRGWATYVAGELTTLHTREDLFETFVHHRSAGWHDMHSKASLGDVLGNGAISTRSITSDAYSPMIAIATIVIGGITVAFIGCPELAGVMLIIIPALGAAAAMQMATAVGGEEAGAIPELEPSNELASNIIMNSELISSLGRSAEYLAEYCAVLSPRLPEYYRKAALKAAAANFAMQLLMFSAFGIAFYVGAILVDDGTCSIDGMTTAVLGLIFCAYVAGMQASHIPNTKAALKNAVKAYALLTDNDADSILSLPPTGLSADIVDGEIDIKGVSFAYPSRPDSLVLQNLSLTVKSGETVALVGGSGSGKSTLLLLLQKLYRPQSGTIEIDGQDLAQMNTTRFREQTAVVSQEVRLFDRTILENIAYRPSPGGHVLSAEDKEKAARAAASTAHAEGFISEKGLDFRVGHRGEKLSGGQRQRVAISRALFSEEAGGAKIRLVLLDEATSALDVESEGYVQDALNKLQTGRTTIVVAHRLNTIKNADVICVMSGGKIAEQGKFDNLVADESSLFYQFYKEHFHLEVDQ